ncbi:MAG: heparinase II/III family protein [Planctomycetota bacterium]|nr:heparinase II/III family protein [Planctomycetota bacterium]
MRRGILATRDELKSLSGRLLRKPFDRIYNTLRQRCSLILDSAPITEAQWRSLWEQGRWGAAVESAKAVQGRILDLLIAHHVEDNVAYRDRAIEELKNLIGWSTWTDPCHGRMSADLCTAEAAVAAVVGLDWLWEDLSEANRLRVLQAIRHQAVEPYRKGVDSEAFWYNCYHHWNAVINCGCGLAALALGDEEPHAQKTYHLARAALKHFFDALGREGGWDEGTGYWGYAMRYVLLLAEAESRLMDDQSLFHSRGMDTTGLFGAYFSPNGQPASFGDWPAVPLHGAFYLLVKHYGVKEVAWWLDEYSFHRDVGTTGWSAAGLAMLFRPVDLEARVAPNLIPVKVFHEIGWGAMADCWPKPNFYAAAKTGDLSANHSQHDMNSIQLQVDGEMLLIDLGHGRFSREYFSEGRDGFYEVQAQSHNTVTVAERDHRIDAQGTVVEAQCDKNYRWVACDAGEACGENIHFVRHLIMTVQSVTQAGQMLIVMDELANAVAEPADLTWHTGGKIELGKKTPTGAIVGETASVYFALASAGRLKISTKTHKCGRNRTEHILHARARAAKRMLLVSVFSRTPLKGKIAMKKNANGSIRLKVEGVDLHFKRLKRHLQLDKASFK